jgi:hypothetical protein
MNTHCSIGNIICRNDDGSERNSGTPELGYTRLYEPCDHNECDFGCGDLESQIKIFREAVIRDGYVITKTADGYELK